MNQTGGGLITNSRTSQPSSSLPKAQPMKPLQPAQQAAPQQAPQQGIVQPQAAPPTQPQAPQGAPQGAPPQGAQQSAPQGVNDVASNALSLLHDPQAGPQFEQMIAQGPKGGAQAAALIYEQVVTAHEQNNSPIDEEFAGQAAEAIIQDISDIGLSIGSFKQEPMIDGNPASVMEFVAQTGEMLSEKFPQIAQAFQEIAGEAGPEDDAAGQQLAQHVGAQR